MASASNIYLVYYTGQTFSIANKMICPHKLVFRNLVDILKPPVSYYLDCAVRGANTCRSTRADIEGPMHAPPGGNLYCVIRN